MTPEFAAQFAALIAENYRQEIETTKRVISAMPVDTAKWAYRPDPKSMSAIELAWHIATSDVWFLNGFATVTFVFDPAKTPAQPATLAGMLEWYDTETRSALDKFKNVSPEQWARPIKLMVEKPLAMHLTFAVRHSIHHRGQLSAYLRPMGGKVPSIYGPSADEQ